MNLCRPHALTFISYSIPSYFDAGKAGYNCRPCTCSVVPYVPLGPFPQISQVAVGTWSWGNRLLFGYDPSIDAELESAFVEAVLNGVNFFDTADSYGTGSLNGRAETLLGRFLRQHSSISSDAIIATKYASYPWRLTRQSIVDAAARSAERLGRPADLGQIHWSASKYAPWQEQTLWDGLADAMEKGYCRHIGVSNFGPRQLERIVHYLQTRRGIQLASVQVQTSLLSRQHLQPGAVADTARRLGVGYIGYSPLCLGLLSGKYSRGNYPTGPRGLLFSALDPEPLLNVLTDISTKRQVKPAQVAVAWCAAQNVVTIVGVRTPHHILDSIAACNISLSQEELTCLELAASKGRQMIQNAFQTA